MYKKLKFTSFLLGSLVIASAITGCGGSSGSSSSTSGGGGGDVPLVKNTPQVKISQMSTMPIVAGSGAKYYVGVYNDTAAVLNLQSIATTNAQNSRDNLSGEVTALYNGAGCARLQPNQSCTIAVTPTITEKEPGGGFLLNVAFGASDGKTYKASQVLQYGKLTGANGITVANNNMRVVAAAGSKSYVAVPYVLGDNVLAKPSSSITPLSENDICDGKYCTHFYSYRGGDFTSKISFVNTRNAFSRGHHASKASSLKDTIVAAGFTINSTVNSIANVLTDGYNTVLTAGGVAVPVVLQNTGLADASISSITSTTDNISISNSCAGSTIGYSSNTTCTFNLSTSATTNGNGTVTITYNNGQTTDSIILNVIYLAKEAAPGLSISTNGGSDLTGAIHGETKEVLITIKNNSGDNTKLNNLKIGRDSDSKFVLNTAGVTSPCDTNGSTMSLEKDAECNFKVIYTPLAGSEGGTFNLAATAQYVESSGHSVNLLAHLPILYSSVTQSAHLSVSDFDFGIMRADGHTESTHTFTIINDGQAPATGIAVAALVAPLAIVNGSDTCTGQTISPANTCTVTVKFAAQTQQLASTMQQLVITYNLRSGSTLGTTTSQANITYAATPAALVEEPAVVVPAPGASDAPIGDISVTTDPDTQAKIYEFYPTLGANGKLKLTFTYTNSGTESAENFIVAANTLPIGFEVNTTASTCQIAAPGSTLAVTDGSCELVVEYVSSAYLSTFGVSALNADVVKPGYSYKDTSTGVNVMPAKVTIDKINALNWGTVNATSSAPSRTATITFELNTSGQVPTAVANSSVTVSMPKLLGNGLTGSNSCTISSFTNGATCTITVTAEGWVPAGEYSYEYYAVPTAGAAASLPFRGVANFTIN